MSGIDRTHRIVTLGSLLESSPQSGYSPVCPKQPTGQWVLGLSALKDEYLDVSEAKPAPLNEPLLNKFLLKHGDFLISRSNTLDRVGRVAVFRGGLENCSYPDLMMRFRPRQSAILPDYLELYLKSETTLRYIRRHAAGTSGSMKKINQGIVESIPIALPTPEEQQLIATIAVEWNLALKKNDELIAARQMELSSLHQRLFRARVCRRPSWMQVPLSTLMVPRHEPALPSETLPLYSLTIEDGITPKTERYNRQFLVKDVSLKEYSTVYPGDIVFNPANLRWGAIARSQQKHPVVVSPIYEVLQIREDLVNPVLLSHSISCPEQIARFATKTEGTLIERMAVKLDSFLRTKLWLPRDRDEQNKLADLLSLATDAISIQKNIGIALRVQKRALLQKLIAGDRRFGAHAATRGA
jgi:type I restriction enzyme S subunit